jgi:thymidylate kinase
MSVSRIAAPDQTEAVPDQRPGNAAVHPPSDDIPLAQIESALIAIGNAMILRNHDITKNLLRGGDIDVLSGHPREAAKQMALFLGPPLWMIERSYVSGHYYSWGHIDLLPRIEWHGAVYLNNRSIIDGSGISEFGFRKPRPAHEALICWFSSLLWGGFFKSRYRPMIEKAAVEDAEGFRRSLTAAVGRSLGEYLFDLARAGRSDESVRHVAVIRRQLWWQSFLSKPLQTVSGWAAYWQREIVLRLRPQVPWVAFVGPDGSGKTSAIQALAAKWQSRGYTVRICHFLPHRLHAWPSRGAEATIPHARPPRGAVRSSLTLCLIVAEWFAGYWFRVATWRAKADLVLFERSFLDVLIDSGRYGLAAPKWVIRWTVRYLPKPSLVIVLDAPLDILCSRNEKLSAGDTARQQEVYRSLPKSVRNAHLVDTSGDIACTVTQIERVLRDHSVRPARGTTP